MKLVDQTIDRIRIARLTVKHNPSIWKLALLGNVLAVLILTLDAAAFYVLHSRYPEHSNLIILCVIAVIDIPVAVLEVFFEALLFSVATSALEGNRIAIKDALAHVRRNKKALLGWWIFSSVVRLLSFFLNMALDNLAQYLGGKWPFITNLLEFLGGLAWAVASYFTIPILMTHPDKPFTVLKQSTGLVKKTWGERVMFVSTAFSILLLAMTLAGTASGVVDGIITLIYPNVSQLVYIISWIIFQILVLVPLSVRLSATSSLFKASLYRYADTGDYVGPFTKEMLEGAFKRKTA